METVYALSFSRPKALERLDNLSLTISEHIFKVCVLPKHESANHWKNELVSWRKQLTRYNQSKMKSLNYNTVTLKKYLYLEPLGTDQDLAVLKKMVELDYSVSINLPNNIHKLLEKKIDLYIESVFENNDNWRK